MYDAFERTWVSLIDSDRFRRFTKRGAGASFFRTGAYQRLRLAKHYLTSYYADLKAPALFKDVETFCLFIGHNKSGTSMLGSLLDAHPNAILSDEAGALDYVSAGFGREQLFHLLVRSSRREFMKGRITARRLTPYSYLVPGQWQGRYRTLRVVGDGAAGSTTRKFAATPALLPQLQKVMGPVRVKFIQVIRNPYDPISVSIVRGGRSFEEAIEHYFTNCETLVTLRQQLDESTLLALRYEEFVIQPESNLARLCHYLGIEADDEYLQACLSILHPAPDQNRQMTAWESKWIDAVREKIEQFDFLEGYSFAE
jgi:hypothetical protein